MACNSFPDRRGRIIEWLARLGFLVLALRLAYVQLWRTDFQSEAPVNYEKPVVYEIPARRGGVSDRNGIMLTAEVRHVKYFVDAQCVDPKDQWCVATNLAAIFPNTDAEKLDALISRQRETGNRYKFIDEYEDDEIEKAFDALKRPKGYVRKMFRGIMKEAGYRRRYPLGTNFCHVVGFMTKDGGGIGIEKKFDKMLRGKPGYTQTYHNARGQEIFLRREREVAPQDGFDIELTLDCSIQQFAVEAVRRGCEKNGATAGWAVVYDCTTGEVLAMADWPSMDPERVSANFELWNNRCVSYSYEPGSTMKPFTVAAALDAKAITPKTPIDCMTGPMRYGGHLLHDHYLGPNQTAATILAHSSNIGTAQIVLRMGQEPFYDYLLKGGFGRPTGVDLPNEIGGVLSDVKNWWPVTVTRVCLGQGIEVTALQMAAVYGAIANGGVKMEPHVVRRIWAPGHERILRETKPRVAGRIFSEKSARAVAEMMEGVVTAGTGKKAAVPGFRVAGKTGTAQILVNGRYSDDAFWGSFFGFFPMESPKYVIVVTLERPSKARRLHHGGVCAAPVFAEIATEIAEYEKLSSAGSQEAPISEDVSLLELAQSIGKLEDPEP